MRYMDLPSEAEEMIESFQRTKCEDANDTIRALITKGIGNLVYQAFREGSYPESFRIGGHRYSISFL